MNAHQGRNAGVGDTTDIMAISDIKSYSWYVAAHQT
jgi:hypothetical protein